MDYKTFIKAVHNLPSPSTVLIKIGEVVKNPEATAAEIAEVIRLDPAIVSKVLRLANSAYLGVPRTVTSLQNAIVLLGNKRVHSLVLASELLNSIKGSQLPAFTLKGYWLHSITTAIIAENIAHHFRKGAVFDENEIFIGGLLHDIGKLVIAELIPEMIPEVHSRLLQNRTSFWRSEDPQLNHTLAGLYLTENWSFPAMLCAIIKHHHEPEKSDDFFMAVSIIHIADVTAHMIGRSVLGDEVPPEISKFALETVALSPEQFKMVTQSAITDKEKVDSLLELFSSASANVKTI